MEPCRAFHRFPELPSELRLAIWETAISLPTIIVVAGNGASLYSIDAAAISQTCHEARYVVHESKFHQRVVLPLPRRDRLRRNAPAAAELARPTRTAWLNFSTTVFWLSPSTVRDLAMSGTDFMDLRRPRFSPPPGLAPELRALLGRARVVAFGWSAATRGDFFEPGPIGTALQALPAASTVLLTLVGVDASHWTYRGTTLDPVFTAPRAEDLATLAAAVSEDYAGMVFPSMQRSLRMLSGAGEGVKRRIKICGLQRAWQ